VVKLHRFVSIWAVVATAQLAVAVPAEAHGLFRMLRTWQMDFHFLGLNPDFDGDGVYDHIDNCYKKANPFQDDTDGDGYGNVCDADYDNDGLVGFSDFGAFSANFASTNALYNHTEPVTDAVGFGGFGFFAANFGLPPGPYGSRACP